MRCFVLVDRILPSVTKQAIEVTDIEYNSNNRMVNCFDIKTGTPIKVAGEDIIVIDNENEMSIFGEEYNIL